MKKIKTLVFVCCMSLVSSLFAATTHLHPHAKPEEKPSVNKSIGIFGLCEIEINNYSSNDVQVYGLYDDGTALAPFYMYRYGVPHYIDLYYYGYCHTGMNLYIDTLSGYPIYASYTTVGSRVEIYNRLYQMQVKVTTH